MTFPLYVLHSLRVLLPDMTSRAIAEGCRRGRFPGARKIGGSWMISAQDWELFVTGRRRVAGTDGTHETRSIAPPTVAQAAAELRRRGVI